MSEARHNAIGRLLDARHEHLPEPVRRSEISSGFVHGLDPKGKPWRWISCPDCLTNDRVMYGCEECGGRGWIPDPDGRDPMAESKVVAYGADGSKHDLAYARDREIERLGQQLRPPRPEVELIEEANARGYAWEEARRRLYQDTDLAALEREIEWLRQSFPGVKLLGGCRGSGPSGCFTLAFLDMVLPDPLRAPGVQPKKRVRGPLRPEAGADALVLRDTEMRARADAGATPAELAAEFRVSQRTVYRVVNAEQEAA